MNLTPVYVTGATLATPLAEPLRDTRATVIQAQLAGGPQSTVAVYGHSRPYRLDHAERPSACQEPIGAREGATAGEGEDESAVAALERVHEHHEADRARTEDREHEAKSASAADPSGRAIGDTTGVEPSTTSRDSEAELAATREPLPERIEAILDSFHVRPLLEYVARRVGVTPECAATLQVKFTDGRMRAAYVNRGPFSVLAFEELARPPAPPLPGAGE